MLCFTSDAEIPQRMFDSANEQISHEDNFPVADDTSRIVGAAAQRDRRFLITQNLDFPDPKRFAPEIHCGILLMRLR
jgi:predicted nuclease of predicted toxin-antitoxin system